MKRNLKGQRSFTLIELLITMVVSALVINGVIMSIVNSMVLNQYNQEFSIAMNIARAEIEESISQKTNFTGIVSESGATSELTLANDGLRGCKRKVVTNVVLNELRNVRVFVCWVGRGGRLIGNCVDLETQVNPVCTTPLAALVQSPVMLETAVARR